MDEGEQRPEQRRSQRLPPYSEEAERGVLGSALLDPERVLNLAVERGLTPESFYRRRHVALFEVLLEMTSGGRPVDLLTVGERLKSLQRLSEVGGETYLEELVDSTPTAAHAEYYIGLVYGRHLLRQIIERSGEAIERCYSSDEDPRTVLGQSEEAILEISRRQHAGIRSWSELVKEGMGEIEKIFVTRKPASGLASGFADLDEKTMGFKPGEMIILAARPSMGKTSLALNICENVASQHPEDPQVHGVAVFSLEMSSDQLVRRMLCSHARIPSQKLAKGYIGEVNHSDLAQAADVLMKAPVYLDDTAALDALELRSRARRMSQKHDISLVIVDYLQMLNYSQYAREGRQRETAAISGAMKAMAKELKVPVLVLSQLSRAPETRGGASIPKLSDLRDSGSIEQDADVVLLLRRPCKYPEDERSHDLNLAVVDVAKNRNGPTGPIDLNFSEEFTRFDSRLSGGVDHDIEVVPGEGMDAL